MVLQEYKDILNTRLSHLEPALLHATSVLCPQSSLDSQRAMLTPMVSYAPPSLFKLLVMQCIPLMLLKSKQVQVLREWVVLRRGFHVQPGSLPSWGMLQILPT